MLKAIVAFSLRFRGIVIALACLAFGYGVYSAINAKLGVFPEFAPPQTMIQTDAPGLAPVMAPLTPAAAWFLTVGLTSKKLQPMDLWSFAYWTMRPRLLAVPGVAKA